MDDLRKEIFRRGMSAFGGAAPTYHIELRERSTMVWDFHSLLLQIQFTLSVMLTDEHCRVSCCPNCGRVFVSNESGVHICEECWEKS